MPDQNHIIIQGLCQNNLKNISLKIPKQKLVVFTGVSGSGKSSIVFDTIAAESQRQMNETYSAYVRGRLPKYEKPKTERIENLSPSVIIDQTPLGGNARSTVGTISDMYSALRLLYSRIGEPCPGGSRVQGTEDPKTVPGDPHQPGDAAGGGVYHLCAVCRGIHGAGLPHWGSFVGSKASRQLGGIPWKLAPYPGFHLKHRDDGGRYCEK